MLCNWTVTFYSLPELSPVFGTTQVKNCNWIGGLDLNHQYDNEFDRRSLGVTILLSLNRRIQVVRIGEDARVSQVRIGKATACSRLRSQATSLTLPRKLTLLEAPSRYGEEA